MENSVPDSTLILEDKMFAGCGLIGLLYEPCNGRFIDEDGQPVLNIYEILSPTDVVIFRHLRESYIFSHKGNHNMIVEVFWPSDDLYTIDQFMEFMDGERSWFNCLEDGE